MSVPSSPSIPSFGRPHPSNAMSSLKSNVGLAAVLVFLRVVVGELDGWGWVPESMKYGAVGRGAGTVWIGVLGFAVLNAAFALFALKSPPPPPAAHTAPARGTPRVGITSAKPTSRPLEGIAGVTPRRSNTFGLGSSTTAAPSPLANSFSASQGSLNHVQRRASNIFAPSSSTSPLGASSPVGNTSMFSGSTSAFGSTPGTTPLASSTASSAWLASSTGSAYSVNDSPLAYRMGRSVSNLSSSTTARPVDSSLLREFLKSDD